MTYTNFEKYEMLDFSKPSWKNDIVEMLEAIANETPLSYDDLGYDLDYVKKVLVLARTIAYARLDELDYDAIVKELNYISNRSFALEHCRALENVADQINDKFLKNA